MCAYQILDIKRYQVTSQSFLLDANVWLLHLKPPSALRPDEQAYIDFVDKVMKAQDSPSQKKEIPKIVTLSLIISEVYNAYLKTAFENWKEQQKLATTNSQELNIAEKLQLKRDYRKTDDYLEAVEVLKSDLGSYFEYVTLMDDDAHEIDPINMLSDFPANTDFNDYY